MTEWIKKAIEQQEKNRKETSNYVEWKIGKNYLTLDLTREPTKIIKDYDGKKKAYYQFMCIDEEHLGKLASCTEWLYDKIVTELQEYKEQNIIAASFEIRMEKPSVNKTEWTVIVKNVK